MSIFQLAGIVCIIALMLILCILITKPKLFRVNSVNATLIIILLIGACILFVPTLAKGEEKPAIASSYVELDGQFFKIKHDTIRFVTAYNAGDPAQTDDTPCIAANNKNICEALERGESHCAANFVPLGTKLYVDKVGVCTVTDRMNKRYRHRVDIAMVKEDKEKALKFAKQKLRVMILEEVDLALVY